MSSRGKIDPVEALDLSAKALDLANDKPAEAVALLVHALAGAIAMTTKPEGLGYALREAGGFGPVLAEALPVMFGLVADIENGSLSALAKAQPAGRA